MIECTPLGDQALLVTCPHPAALAAAIDLAAVGGVRDVVPTKESVLVVFDGGATNFAHLRDQIRRIPIQTQASQIVREHQIPMRYDGLDLAEVASRCGLSIEAVIELHSNTVYTVALVGFLPGFPYLDGLPTQLHLPRRDSPRPHVPAGSIAIAGSQTGIYPQASPGGWHILGTTTIVLFDPTRSPPALMSVGDLVHFVPTKGLEDRD